MGKHKKEREPKNLTGIKFGLLTVVRPIYKVKGFWHYVCKCQCGNESIVRMDNLRQGHTTSCGCLSRNYHQRVIPESPCEVATEKICKECGEKFTITIGEKKWYEEVMGWVMPERCKPCRSSKHRLHIKTA